MTVFFAYSPRSMPKFAGTQKLTRRNALFIVIAVIVFQVGFMSGRVGSHDVGMAVRGLLNQDLDMSQFSSDELSSPLGVQQQPSSRISVRQKPSPPISVLRINENVKEPNVRPPLSLKQIFPLTRNSADANFHKEHPWSQPLVLQAYMRYKADANDSMEVVLITTGVSMGTYQRNFTAAGCMIGNHVYPVDNFLFDTTRCTVPKGIKKHQPMTLVIFRDEVVEAALKGPVTIAKEYIAELEDGDLRPLKDGTILHGRLVAYDLKELIAVKSRLVYSEQLDPYSPTDYKALPRYEVCLGTQIKPSTDLLPDWLDYHRRLGVDFVYVFDNHAEEDVSELLADRQDVEVLYWPWERSQIQAFTYAVYAMRARCEWVLLMDSDEYVMLGLDGSDRLSTRALPPLKRYIRDKEKQGFAQVWFHWLIMKNSGYVQRPEGAVPEAYIHREYPQLTGDQEVTLGKTMTSMDYEWIFASPHSRRPLGKALSFNDLTSFDDHHGGSYYPKQISDTGMIVHYRQRSWVEFQEKVRSGRANINNPNTVSHMKLWDARAGENFKEPYMKSSRKNRKEYTHFRDIWRRVSRELKVGKCVTRRLVDGRWCRTFYNLSKNDLLKPMKEQCEAER